MGWGWLVGTKKDLSWQATGVFDSFSYFNVISFIVTASACMHEYISEGKFNRTRKNVEFTGTILWV